MKKLISYLMTTVLVLSLFSPLGALAATEVVWCTEHKWEKEYTVDEKASCFKNGSRSFHCEVCDYINPESVTVIAMREHTLEDTTVAEAATCTSSGKMNQACINEADTEYESCEYESQREIPVIEHSWDEGEITTESTCTAEGVKTYKCVSCEGKKTEAVPVIEHSWDEGEVTTEPTCTAEGVKTYKCVSCEGEKTEAVPVIEHSWDEGEVTTEPTCTAEGVKTYKCVNCEEEKTESVPVIEHSWDEGEVTTEPTCTAEGVKTYKCANCEEEKTETLPILEHEWNEGEVTTEPTCTAEGVKTYKCVNCEEEKTETLPILEHEWNEGEITTEPTCTAEGVKTYKCANCEEEKTETLPILEHEWNEGEITTEPTCTAEGVKTYKCANCEEEKTETLPILEHEWNEGEITTEPTCTNEGVKTYKCANCEEEKTETLPVIEHEWNEGEITTDVTCTTDGIKTFSCVKCKEKRTELVLKSGHLWDEGTVTDYASCTQSGIMTYICAQCGEEKTKTLSATGHDYQISEVFEPTCSRSGYTAYTCINGCGSSYSEINLDSVIADHSFTLVSEKTVWAEDYSKATLYFVCDTCGKQVSETDEKPSCEVIRAANCNQTGENKYTARVRVNFTDYEASATVNVPVRAHSYAAPVWSWSGTDSASLVLKCNVGGERVVVDAQVSSRLVSKATLSADGKTEHTAKASYGGKSYTNIISTAIDRIGKVTLSSSSFTYNGKTQKPTVTVRDSKGKVIPAGKYSVKYSDSSSKSVGKYTVTVTFTDDSYSGKTSLSYTISLGKATGLKASGRKLTWKAVKGAEKYEVYLYDSAKKAYKKVKTVAKPVYTVESKYSCGTFKAYVIAVNGKNKSAKSSVLTFKSAHKWSKTGPECLNCKTVDKVVKYKKITMTPNKYKVGQAYKSKLILEVQGKYHTYKLTTTKKPQGFTTKTAGKKTMVFKNYGGVKCTYTVTR